MEFLKSMFSEETGASATRVIITYCMFLFFTCFSIVWTAVSFKEMHVSDVPVTVTGLIIALGAWKLGQKVMEK